MDQSAPERESGGLHLDGSGTGSSGTGSSGTGSSGTGSSSTAALGSGALGSGVPGSLAPAPRPPSDGVASVSADAAGAASAGGGASAQDPPGASRTPVHEAHRRELLGMGRMTGSSWREEALASAAEMSTLLEWLCQRSEVEGRETLCDAARTHLLAVSDSVHSRVWGWAAIRGSAIDRTVAHLNAAEAHLLRLAPLDHLTSVLPNLLVHARSCAADDPRRLRLEEMAERARQGPLTDADRPVIVAAYQGANAANRRVQTQSRNFRNLVLATALLSVLLSVGIAVVSFVNDHWLPVCFAPEGKLVCATAELTLAEGQEPTLQQVAATAGPWDVALIQFVGLLGAAVAAAASLRRLGSDVTNPYGVPIAVALLKIATGALTAFLGLLLMRAGFVPGLSALDSTAQIIAWAILLGYAQELFTRVVDTQAGRVMTEESGRGAGAPTGQLPRSPSVLSTPSTP